MPSLKIDMPKRKEWLAWSEALMGFIYRRTIGGKDWQGKAFKKYSAQYGKRKAAGKIKIAGGVGRHLATGGGVVNLTLSSRMLKAMKAASTRFGGKVTLSGEEADKARGNEKNGRVFMAVNKTDTTKIVKLVDRWLTKKNGFT